MNTVGKETDVFTLRLYQWVERFTTVPKMKLLLFQHEYSPAETV